MYENKELGFSFYLPADWKGYTVVNDKWEGTPVDGKGAKQTGPELILRNPKWTKAKPYQDIPIMVFTTEQWAQVAAENLAVTCRAHTALDVGTQRKIRVCAARKVQLRPTPPGMREVDTIIAGQPLWPMG